MLVGKASSLPETGASDVYICFTNIRLGWKGMLVVNTLTYDKPLSITAIESFKTLGKGPVS